MMVEERPDHLLLVLSNFIAAKIRNLLNGTHELYEKWYIADASNGVILYNNSEHLISTYFYTPENFKNWENSFSNDSDSGHEKFDDMVVCWSNALREDKSLTSTIKQAYHEGKKLINDHPNVINQSQILVWACIFRTSEDNFQRVGEEIIDAVSQFIGTKPNHTTLAKHFVSEANHFELTFEFVFHKPITEKELAGKLKTCLSESNIPLSGFGRIIGDCIDPRLHWAHIFTRQFYFDEKLTL